MRIPSGVTDQKIFFVALDTTLTSRVTGLSSFTVYRSRNGGTATVYTTPTVAELSAANMPGVYCLTVDEDTTVASTSDSEEYAVHITATGMAPVTRTIEFYRRTVTANTTLTTADVTAIKAKTDSLTFSTALRVDSQVFGMQAGTVTAAAVATDAIDNDAIAANAVTEIQAGLATSAAVSALPTAATIAGAVWNEDATAHQTQGTFGQAIGDPVADTNTIYKAVVTDGTAATVGLDVVAVLGRLPAALVSGRMDSSVGAMATDVITSGAVAASAVTEIQTGLATGASITTLQADTDDIQARLPAALVGGRMDASVGAMAANVITAAATAADFTTEVTAGLATEASITTLTGYVDTEVAAILAAVDTEVAAIKAKTDSLTFTVAGYVDSNIQAVNDTTVTGSGTGGSPWGP